jgi:mRNA-degrading endonuclease RelE of RelBE toxin-antitoxin system
VAAAAAEFVTGDLLTNPYRVGAPLRAPYAGQRSARCGPAHRIRYEIDPVARTVTVLDIAGRADAYRRD